MYLANFISFFVIFSLLQSTIDGNDPPTPSDASEPLAKVYISLSLAHPSPQNPNPQPHHCFYPKRLQRRPKTLSNSLSLSLSLITFLCLSLAHPPPLNPPSTPNLTLHPPYSNPNIQPPPPNCLEI
ncbi:unnamed protein product [Ilex paraguariensis]|uniref:Transmembrane protein n=1 Tax=Ilex paraguariensis TaxID=185542 RepID=A0ABC8QRQ4_9AQUA